MTISFTSSGSFKNTEKFLAAMKRQDFYSKLEGPAKRGVEALRAATPKESGVTADSWGYEIEKTRGGAKIIWTNTHQNQGTTIAIILQYGHGTGTGGYVAGRDYINPAIRPIFDEIADTVWKAVTSA